MKITKKQKEEVDWLCPDATDDEIEEYISKTVHGGKTGGVSDTNRIFQAKRRLDITVAMWREDIKLGILFPFELRDGSRYMDRVVNGILRGFR